MPKFKIISTITDSRLDWGPLRKENLLFLKENWLFKNIAREGASLAMFYARTIAFNFYPSHVQDAHKYGGCPRLVYASIV